ncbi:MAG: glycosyl hydrolase family 8 [Lachnospiraceae bacterium]|jgi:oligosaccharide reducing-end xylanase|nr:glycosyl hydrolase family 8 [Lachnospiraceae bacterium]
MAAFETKQYRNLFSLIGKEDQEVKERLNEIFETFFYGSEEERIYHPAGEDMGYLEDTGNHDARTEGMSYGMMICVQMDKKEEFDRIWKWACTYMWMEEGESEGYFAWSCRLDGTRNADGAAPDGEEFFAMALFFASHRWGDGEGIYCYSEQAKKILRACIHKGENGRPGYPMWNHENKQILFVPGSDFTDPSYHLPHFYELFALWADEEDRPFFKEAAKVSREYLAKACHPKTGMSAEYAEFDGKPMSRPLPWTTDRHDWFFSDAYRTAANIGLDYEWFGIDEGQYEAPEKLLRFLDSRWDDHPFEIYEVDGTSLHEPALHPVGLQVTTTQGILAVLGRTKDDESIRIAKKWLEEFFRMPLREGDRRYYDNCLYFFAFLALSGNYRIW